MAGLNDEEFQTFINQNRYLIERMMELQKEAAVNTLATGREIAHDAKDVAKDSAEMAKRKTEEFMMSTYNMFMDPDVQRHFMAMGMEFMMAVTALMQKAPIPDFVKDATANAESNWKQSACRTNEDCNAKKHATKVDINPDPEPREGPIGITVTDRSEEEQ